VTVVCVVGRVFKRAQARPRVSLQEAIRCGDGLGFFLLPAGPPEKGEEIPARPVFGLKALAFIADSEIRGSAGFTACRWRIGMFPRTDGGSDGARQERLPEIAGIQHNSVRTCQQLRRMLGPLLFGTRMWVALFQILVHLHPIAAPRSFSFSGNSIASRGRWWSIGAR